MVPLPDVSWAWVPAWGSLEPPRRDGGNAQRTGKTGKKWARYGPKRVNKEGTGGITWGITESRSEGHLIAQPVSVHISLRTDPMRGGKYSLFEGGIRANSFVSGGLLPAAVRGTTLHGLLHVSDWSV